MIDGLLSFIVCSIVSISPGQVEGFSFPPYPYSEAVTHHQSVQERVRGVSRQPGLSARLPPLVSVSAAAEINQNPIKWTFGGAKTGYCNVLCIFYQHFPKQMLAEG